MTNFSDRHPNQAGPTGPPPAYPGYPSYPGGSASYGGGSNVEIKRSFNQLLLLLKRGWRVTAIVFLLVTALVTVTTFVVEPEYSASTLLLLNRGTTEGANQNALNYGLVESVSSDESASAQTLILKESILIAERTIDDLLRDGQTIRGTELPHTFLADRDKLAKELNHEPTTTDWAKYLQKEYIRIHAEGDDWQTSGIRIEVRSSNPDEAAEIANAYADEYKRFSQEISRDKIVQSKAFLEDQIEKHKTELQAIEDRISEYQRSQSAVSLDASSNLTVTQLALLQSQLGEARVEKSMLQAGLDAKEKQLAAMRPALSQGLTEGLEVEIGKVRDRITEYENKLEPIYQKNPELRDDPSGEPYVLGMTQQLAIYRSRLRELSELYAEQVSPTQGGTATGGVATASALTTEIENDKVRLSQIDSKIAGLGRSIASSAGQLRAIPTKSQELAQLERQRTSAESSYLNLTDKLQQVRIAEESKVGVAEILRPAFVPLEPERPNKARNIGLGLLLGFMLGLAAAIVRYWMDSRVYSPDDIVSRGLTVLGAIPNMEDVIRTDFGGKKKVDYKGAMVNSSLTTLLSPASPSAEAYRRLFVNLRFSLQEHEIQTLVVTSPEASVGKSTTALNLAATAARAKRRTLILDADLHRPMISEYLGATEGQDLEEILASMDASNAPRLGATNGHGSKSSVRSDSVEGLDLELCRTSVDNLYVVAPMAAVADSAEMLGSGEFGILLERLRGFFDLIVIDTPPVLLTADAAIVSRAADATIVVVAAGETDSQAMEHSVNELIGVGANVLGAVINRFDPGSIPGYKSTYQYRYQYYNEYYRGTRAKKLATT